MTTLAIRIGSALLASAVIAMPAAAQSRVHVSGRAGVRAGPVRAQVVVRPTRRRAPHRHYDDHEHRRVRDYRTRATSYCSSGYGHPRGGWSWCVDRGFVRPYFDGEWVATYHHNVRFRRAARMRSHGYLGERKLRQVIGHRSFDRLHDHSHRIGRYGPLSGEWIYLRDGGLALGVFADGYPIAELRDQNRDGRVDVTFLADRPQGRHRPQGRRGRGRGWGR